jgi:hypothetical protein
MQTVNHCKSDEIHIRLATAHDAMNIAMLYQAVYGGHYTNPLMRETTLLTSFLSDPKHVWVIAEIADRVSHESTIRSGLGIVGSVVYEIDSDHRLAKAYGGAVLESSRGHRILEKVMIFAEDYIMKSLASTDVVYAMTRTSTPAPQIVTEHLGYKKLGVFPNVHKTDAYETHCLTAKFSQKAIDERFVDFRIHPNIRNLYEIVRTECQLSKLENASASDLELDNYSKDIELELIDAALYTKHRYLSQRGAGLLQAHFFPFHDANLVVSSPCQTVELFCYVAKSDKHCTIMAVKKPTDFDFTHILERTVKLLNAYGVRYIEILVRADKVKTLERVIRARFIPSAYFPAFQMYNGRRYDCVALSRTFEILDFTFIKLSGKNRVFLDEYIRNIQEYFLKPQIDMEKTP